MLKYPGIETKAGKAMKLKVIDANGTLQGFVLVKSCEKKITKNGSSYLDLSISDGETDVVAKIWDFRGADEEKPAVNTVILVRGTLGNYNGQPQFKIDRWRATNANDAVRVSDFVPSSAFEGADMFAELAALAESFKDEQLKTLTKAVLGAYRARIVDLPAAYTLHHAVRGGLMMHTLSICKLAESVCALYPSVDRDLLLCGAILHDVAKSEEFNLAPTGLVSSYSVPGTLVGHLVGGAMLVNAVGREAGVGEETLMLVEHMLISHHGVPEYGAAVRPMFLEALILSALDTLDANVYEVENVIRGVEPGGFSQKVWALDDRKLFNHGRKPVTTDVRFDWRIEQDPQEGPRRG